MLRCAVPVASLLSFAFLLAPSMSHADPGIETDFYGRRAYLADVHVGFAYLGDGYAFGTRMSTPILDEGFVHTLNDALYLTIGADLYYVQYEDQTGQDVFGMGAGIPFTFSWHLYFTKELSAFMEAGVNPYFDPGYLERQTELLNRFASWIIGSVGARYRLSKRIDLVVRVGLPYTSFGAGLRF